jgi:hypothetical protein
MDDFGAPLQYKKTEVESSCEDFLSLPIDQFLH